MSTTINQKNKGFTLVELLVSIALFSIVMVIGLGSILTIVDSNRKARTLMEVMNNLNFAVDSMTRSFKSGQISQINDSLGVIRSDGECFATQEVNYSATSSGLAEYRFVEYCVTDGVLTKKIGTNGNQIPLTSPDVNIQYAKFEIAGEDSFEQPLLTIVLDGEVEIASGISSRFTIHTSVAQRTLNI